MAEHRLDRALQLELLNRLAECYPHDDDTLLDGAGSDEEARLVANLAYLDEHGLIISGIEIVRADCYAFHGAKITAAGLDFLSDDGGLSAILGTVTVKLHADTVRELLAARIESANLPAEEKASLLKHLRNLPAAALTEATKRLVAAGIDHLPDAISWLKTLGAP